MEIKKLFFSILLSAAIISCSSLVTSQEKNDFLFRFVFTGDSRGDYNAKPPVMLSSDILKKFMDIIIKMDPKPEFLFFNGDMVAKTAYRSEEGLKAVDEWNQIVADKMAEHGIKLYIIPGNHIVDQKEKTQGGNVQYIERFRKYFKKNANPKNGPSLYKDVTFSFDHKNTHFTTVISFMTHDGPDNKELTPDKFVHTEQIFEYFVPKENREWLQNDLKNSDKDFKLFIVHCPLYPVGPHYKDKKSLHAHPANRDDVMSILIANNTDAILASHEHLYARLDLSPERIEGLKINYIMPEIIIGSAGAPLYNKKREDIKIDVIKPEYTLLIGDVYKDRIVLKVINENGNEIDKIIIQKKRK